jgi:hypothetical protein
MDAHGWPVLSMTNTPGGKFCIGRMAIGEPLEPDADTRNAERPKREKRKLASQMLGNKLVRF